MVRFHALVRQHVSNSVSVNAQRIITEGGFEGSVQQDVSSI